MKRLRRLPHVQLKSFPFAEAVAIALTSINSSGTMWSTLSACTFTQVFKAITLFQANGTSDVLARKQLQAA